MNGRGLFTFSKTGEDDGTPVFADRDVSVVICAFSDERLHNLSAAVESVQNQTAPARQIIVVIDHNPRLFRRVTGRFQDVEVIENHEAPGLSGARNCGIAAARASLIAFLDDDAVAAPDWLEFLIKAYADPRVCGVGGAIEPVWTSGRPRWLPEEFDWVVGCTYRGMPTHTSPVRNLIGANMSFRREVFEAVGGFRSDMGRSGTRPLGCEETELCVRAHQHLPQQHILYEPRARVQHLVPPRRARWAYFRARCYAEGLSKAQVAEYVGAKDGLASERAYTLRTLPLGISRGLMSAMQGDLTGIARAGAIVAGLTLTSTGYLVGPASERVPMLTRRARLAPLHKTAVSPEPDGTDQEATSNMQLAQGAELTRHSDENGTDIPEAATFKPTRMLEMEISRPLPAVAARVASGQQYERALVLVRLHAQPLGIVELPLGEEGLSAQRCGAAIWRALRTEICAHLRDDGLSEPSDLSARGLRAAQTPRCVQEREEMLTGAPFTSIVVATRNRPDGLATCLRSLLALDYPHFEIIVVDNAPSSNDTAEMIKRVFGTVARVRYVCERKPGLSTAHNRGLQEVRGEIVAFTDDDVLVDRHWLTELVRGFSAAENVGCVTGMIMPMELETPAQLWIEQFGGFGKGYARRVFDLKAHRSPSPLYPYAAGAFGSGANMAFRTDALRAIGGFDPALGAGSPGVGGDDLAAFFQIIVAGYALVYEPAAILHHLHRREYAGLQKQVYGYGVGLTAYLTKCLIDNPRFFWDIAPKIPQGLFYAFSARSPKNARKLQDYPRELTALERKGMLYGPIAYLRGRWRTRGQRGRIHGTTYSGPGPEFSTPQIGELLEA